ncbi:oxidoreductase [Nissabacter archeti]|uniref:oxidoreductase n=1 Tax=Nissabacter archeti TaxID=1917880 RepID=UPI001FEF25AF|nr:oxidoreductase [Nissabacter archeti]
MPPLILFEGDFQKYIDLIYQEFVDSILYSKLTFQGLPVRPRYQPEYNGKELGFWHMTSTGEKEEEREPDIRRCERIKWLRWVIENHTNPAISSWKETRAGVTEVVLWVEQEQYVVVLSERRDYWLLKTAYLATRSGKIRQLTNSRARNTPPQKS